MLKEIKRKTEERLQQLKQAHENLKNMTAAHVGAIEEAERTLKDIEDHEKQANSQPLHAELEAQVVLDNAPIET